ncbi:MAG: sugar ABC transporter permease [Lachnospiraceae bacterium]|nr:sugar ABC transporter permease [Lachnoclostridium sp.]MBQ1240520.1 sugar ABC transporter permease [Lachnospiraceae bacterium]MBQ2106972.1 sugar ABC transporter permease [Lachnospiraceae bacterium]MBQ2250558.1 sugar ABC transporter permease [Lachnospiraceae bacterium]MBQ5600182.1 sugar ABC transporter permease [Lachnospiraceae bacterium]
MEKALKKYSPLFVIPTFAAFVIGFIIPFAEGLYLSFCQFTTVKNAKWVGIANYQRAFADESFTNALGFTVSYAVVSIVVINVIALGLALLLTRKLKGTNIFRTIFFMPNLIGGIVLGYIWQILINCVLSIVGEPLLALNETAGYWGLIILTAWQQIGYMMIIYIAGLQNVPGELLEAAEIDGANAITTLLKVKIPMIMSSITICVFLTLTNSFKLFDQNLALTAGDPKHMTEMLALNIYNTFYARAGAQWKGLGQAKAVIFCILVIAISMIQLKATRSKEVQQ